MSRYNVEADGEWACFSSVSDAFITPFMTLEQYEEWRDLEYGKQKEPLETANKKTLKEALFSLSLNKSNCDIIENLRYPMYKELHKTDGRPIGVFSDVHIPFNHPNYLQFVQDTFKRYHVGQVVCCGDLIDHHAISRHDTETCAKSAYDELDMAIEKAAEYIKAFPKVKLCTGNHDSVPVRQTATLGIGQRFLKSFSELYEIPKSWEIAEEHLINGVLFKHGINCGGKDGALNAAILERTSTVIGHYHSFGGCKYQASKKDIIFGMNVGCGIDIDAYAFAYGKHSKYRPTLGCGVVFNSGSAIFVPMGSEWFRSYKN